MKPPTELRVSSDRRQVSIAFPDSPPTILTAEFLRVFSPSAEVRGHSREERVTVCGKQKVTITGIEPVGHYAVRIVFSDGHQTGLYTWRYLFELVTEKSTKWEDYLKEIAAKGLSRDASSRD